MRIIGQHSESQIHLLEQKPTLRNCRIELSAASCESWIFWGVARWLPALGLLVDNFRRIFGEAVLADIVDGMAVRSRVSAARRERGCTRQG